MLHAFGHPVVTCGDMLGVVGSNLTIIKLEPTRHNMSQHVATGWPNAQHVAPNNIEIHCIDMLRSYGLGFMII